MIMLSLTVPVPPSLNNAYTRGRGHGRRVLSDEGRRYKAAVIQEVYSRCVQHHCGRADFEDVRLGLELRLYFGSRQRRDISNCVKLLEDALALALGFDDCRVDRLLVERAGIDRANPRCEVVLRVLMEAHHA